MPPESSSLLRPVRPMDNDEQRQKGWLGSPVPVNALERETGIGKEVARKWELRYGFPLPKRDENGDRVYSAEQVVSLRLIHRLLGAGLRPGKVVGLDLPALQALIQQIAPETEAGPCNFSQQLMEALCHHDLRRLEHLLRGQLSRQGLSLFVRETVARLNIIVGDAWLRGDIRVFEEHLYTEAVRSVLQDSIRTVTETSGSPRVLLSTPPGELHTLGLLMANAVFSLEGSCCIGLGAQTPTVELATAVEACSVDIVGLSFSVAFPARESAPFLRDLRTRLKETVEIWAGGLGVSRLRRIQGVRFMHSLDDITLAVRFWAGRDAPARV